VHHSEKRGREGEEHMGFGREIGTWHSKNATSLSPDAAEEGGEGRGREGGGGGGGGGGRGVANDEWVK
jgi:hypothetical protein